MLQQSPLRCFISDQSLLTFHSQEPLSFLSMHVLSEVTLDFLMHRLPPPLTVKIRDYFNFDLELFRHFLIFFNWATLYQSVSLDEKITILNQHLSSTRDLHIRLEPESFLRLGSVI